MRLIAEHDGIVLESIPQSLVRSPPILIISPFPQDLPCVCSDLSLGAASACNESVASAGRGECRCRHSQEGGRQAYGVPAGAGDWDSSSEACLPRQVVMLHKSCMMLNTVHAPSLLYDALPGCWLLKPQLSASCGRRK